jgi:RNA polymerase sigma-70 factor (ECF subfamily)
MDARTDLELLQAIQEGADRAALAALYDRYGRKVFALAFGILRDRNDAEDVLQEVFERVWKKSHTFQSALASAGEAKYWILRIAHNRSINLLKSRALRAAPSIDEASAGGELNIAATTEAPQDFDIGSYVRTALGVLPEEQRKLIELAFFKGLSHSEIAESEKLPLGTVKTRIRSGMLKLKHELDFLKN